MPMVVQVLSKVRQCFLTFPACRSALTTIVLHMLYCWMLE